MVEEMSEHIGSEFVSGHDRGAFGELLGRLKAAGVKQLVFRAELYADKESDARWIAMCSVGFTARESRGRTGEEALRRLVEAIESNA
jgi:hypothetical protein